MKVIIITFALIAVALSAPQSGQPVPILKQDQEINPDGTYQYVYETGNGITAEEHGYLKNAGQPEQESQVAEGKFAYTFPEGGHYSVSYVADEVGFHPHVEYKAK